MDESDEHPLRDEVRVARDHGVEESAKWILKVRDLRIVASDCVVGKGAETFGVATGGEKTGMCRRGGGSLLRA